MPKSERTSTPSPDTSARRYVPDARFDSNPLSATKALADELIRFRSHISTIFAGDFRGAYQNTALGVFWNFALPLVPVSVYIMLVNLRVFPSYDGMNAALYIGFNVTLWFLMTGIIRSPMETLKKKNSETMKTALPMSAAIASSFAQIVFDTSVRLVLVIVLVISFSQWPRIGFITLILSIISGTFFCLSLGLFLSIFNVIYKDVERVTDVLLRYSIFLSGVIFPVTSLGPLAILEHLNPFNVFITASRASIFYGGYPDILVLVVWTGISIAMYLIAVRFFYVMERRIRGLV